MYVYIRTSSVSTLVWILYGGTGWIIQLAFEEKDGARENKWQPIVLSSTELDLLDAFEFIFIFLPFFFLQVNSFFLKEINTIQCFSKV